MYLDRISLDQMKVALAVLEDGSFSAAARRFGRTQSAVSYAIAALEGQLGVVLFDRGGNRPVPTPDGAVLIADMAEIIAASAALLDRARAVSQGLETELVLAVDALFGIAGLTRHLKAFAAGFPSVRLQLHVQMLGQVIDTTLATPGAIGVTILPRVTPHLHWHALAPIRLIPVAAPDHPLAQAAPIPVGLVAAAVQIVVADASTRTTGLDFDVVSAQQWRVAELGIKHALIRDGLGWGTMPEHMIAPDIAQGRLVRLDIGSPRPPLMPSLIHQARHRPGPAGRWLIDAIRQDVPTG